MARGQLLPYGSGRQSADPLFMLQRQMEQLFDNAVRSPASSAGATAAVIAPRMDISEDEQEIRVVAEMPGATPDRIEVTVDDDVLTIRGERESARETKRRDYHLIERAVGVFQRSIRLPAPVNADQVQARFEDGVLTLTIPKTSVKSSSRRVQVSSGNGSGKAGATQSGATAASGSDKESSGKTGSASSAGGSSASSDTSTAGGKSGSAGKGEASGSQNKGGASGSQNKGGASGSQNKGEAEG
jgi:HSP20 family protein